MTRLNMNPTEIIGASREAMKAGRAEVAVRALASLVELAPTHAGAWQLLGFALAEEQRMPEAAAAFARAAELEPREPRTAFAHARSSLDAGYPAAALFERALELSPGDLATIIGRAASLIAEGQAQAAEALLADALHRHPDWLAGHKSLADLRFTSGDSRGFARSYAEACRMQPQNVPLRLAWFGAAAKAEDWNAARDIVAEGARIIGARPAFSAACAFIAGESGDQRAEALFAETEGIADDVLRLAHVRHCLRTAQIRRAEGLASAMTQGRSAALIWPYLSIIWRLLGDPRAAWLDGDPPYIREIDLGCPAHELDALAAVLRRLHTARSPYIEQSVRGGTQTDTDRQLFFRAEPEIQRIRDQVLAAVRDYVAALPPPVPGHPLLGNPRDRIRFSGSWSVRLAGQGFHVSHTHPQGWISSALYVALPGRQMGAAPAGWIRFGVPPENLRSSLPAYAQCEPKPGRLILFPSTLWHQTMPFDDGERLVIAFDVMRGKS
jgi:Flp pilus assembly protein TadD